MCADLLDWFAIFFEGCKDRSPTEAGIDLFGLSYSISLIAIVAGIAVKKTGKYLTTIYIGWAMTIVGAGLLTTLGASSSLAKSIAFQIIVGGGVGITYVVTLFPILASIPVTQTAPAMALYVFSRNFGYVRHLLSIHLLPHKHLMDVLLDLGRHHRRRHPTERAEEKATDVFPPAIPAGRPDRLFDYPAHPDAAGAVQTGGAGHLC